ncbi:MAG: hypothetical protein KGR24_02970 [Planctomycetes bacterium]|nr:hypothetical protein [Planctomycetota bacterium]
MRDDLVGYLLNAIDQPEARRIETALADPDTGPVLRRELDTLRKATRVLEPDREGYAPPSGLAARTMAFVVAQATPGPLPTPRVFSPSSDESTPRSRAWLDRVLVAATALAACVLVAPLLLDAITDARARRVERSLQTTSAALQGYAESHRVFPTPPDSGPLSRAGLYAPTLVSEKRLVADDGTLLAPGTALDRQGSFSVPTLEELKAAVGTPRFDELVRTMGGDFGYTLGHRDAAGVLQPNANLRREHHPLMADAPDDCRQKSSNHPDGIHFILYEDGHIERVRQDDLHRDDHLYRNHNGETAAGTDAEDAVIGDSHHQP